tara:strand:+ start:272 stop:721 length:450 start_codon:yes stop_codon:yes gene_type:complete
MRKLERLSGLNTLLGELDDVLEIIRSSGFRYEARDILMSRYGLSMKQVVAFLDMNISNLTGVEQERIRVEYLTEEEEEEKPPTRQKRDDIGKGELISIKEMLTYLPVAEITIRSWINQRRLPVTRLGRRVFVRRETLEKLMQGGLKALA